MILAWLGVVGPSELNRFRRYAIVVAFAAGRGAFTGDRPDLDGNDDATATGAL